MSTPENGLARLLPAPVASRWDTLARVWLGATLCVALWTFGDYGVTWDEAPHLGYGARIVDWYRSGFTDDAALSFRANYYYGGGYDLLGALFRRLAAPMEDVMAVHLLGCIVGVLGLAGTWRLGRALAGPRAGFIALALVTLNPVLYGHMFNNPKDPPFAAAYVWSLYFMVVALAGLPRPSRGTLAKLAVAIGLAMSVRIGGLLLLCYLGLALVLHALHAGWLRRSLAATEAQLHHALRLGGAVGLGAWAVMLLGWPWAQLDPLRRPFIALTRMSGFDAHRRDMPFAGVEMSNFDLGWDYLVHYFALQTPELTLALWLLATAWALALVVRLGARVDAHRQALALLTIVLAIWLPPIYAVAKGSILYDNYRHFLFIIPPACALAAAATEAALTRLRRPAAAALAIVLTVAAVDVAATMVRMHPHEYVYFNRLIGGLGGAVRNYDTDYYGNSFKEAAQGLQRHLWRTERKNYLNTVYRFSGCVSMFAVGRWLPPNIIGFTPAGAGDRPDFHMGYHRYHCDAHHPEAPVIFRVEREGGELNVVKDLRGTEASR